VLDLSHSLDLVSTLDDTFNPAISSLKGMSVVALAACVAGERGGRLRALARGTGRTCSDRVVSDLWN
jgi:hypothetical protein